MTLTVEGQPLIGPEQLQSSVQENPEPAAVCPPASFFRRLAAALIDLLILGALYFILGKLAAFFLESSGFSGPLLYFLGHFDRLISAAIALGYFCLDGVKIGLGRTPGKFVLKLSVRDLRGQPICFRRALLRSAVLAPVFLYFGWSLLAQPISTLAVVENALVYGLSAAVVYLLIANRRAGQSVHDCLAGTRVVDERRRVNQSYPATPRRYLQAAAGLVMGIPLIILGVNLAAGRGLTAHPTSQIEIPLSQVILRNPRYLDVQVTEGYRPASEQPLPQNILVSVTLNPWNDPHCGYWCEGPYLRSMMADYLSANQLTLKDVTVQIVKIFDLGFLRLTITSAPNPLHATYIDTFQFTFLGIFSSSFSIENI